MEPIQPIEPTEAPEPTQPTPPQQTPTAPPEPAENHWIQQPATTTEEIRLRHEANRVAWNEAASAYSTELEQTIAELRAGTSHLHPLERAALGDLRPWCTRAVHLQCASGADTISLLLEGATEVVGVDISDAHIANARRTAEALDAPATFLRCDVLDTPHDLDGTADLVYTGRGALCWIHDLDGWAAVVARLLAPGGVLSILEDHPAKFLFRTDSDRLDPSGQDYFQHAEANRGWGEQYIGGDGVTRQAVKHERIWPLSAVVQALIDQGLVIRRLEEHPVDYWQAFPHLPEDLRRTLPMTFLLLAAKPR
ncbi:class I SAM-dependent methyltransferase [Allostreptomyces psammosilenae]|uniref:SAM-dependent methyltransferase n=1 Tax=Allostreptomyces psammosilenae TaxID=1892865 RepID=A0A852ZXH6_9ACTN|nr:class I SAM-dependent methyltransferase [Allostreptomyces psammosilenae]NYI06725.1 SAM-dependent methyltransferase [Allostreptomyces psammosilenae]